MVDLQSGGVFFKRIEELNEIEGIDIDTDRLDALVSKFSVFSGTWLEDGKSIDLVFDTLEFEVFGTAPLFGRPALLIYSALLVGDNELRHSCCVAGDLLTLDRLSADAGGRRVSKIVGLGSLTVKVVRMVGDFALTQFSTNDANRHVMNRID